MDRLKKNWRLRDSFLLIILPLISIFILIKGVGYLDVNHILEPRTIMNALSIPAGISIYFIIFIFIDYKMNLNEIIEKIIGYIKGLWQGKKEEGKRNNGKIFF